MPPQTTDTGAMNTNNRYWSHKQGPTDTTEATTTDTRATDSTGATNYNKYWSHRTRQQILEWYLVHYAKNQGFWKCSNIYYEIKTKVN